MAQLTNTISVSRRVDVASALFLFSSQRNTTLIGTRELRSQRVPQWHAVSRDLVQLWAAQIEKWHSNGVRQHLQWLHQRADKVVQIIRCGEVDHLEDETQQVVAFQQVGQVQDSVDWIIKVDTGERVDLADIATNAAENRISKHEMNHIQVELDETIVDRCLPPVVWDSLMAFRVGKIVTITADSKEAFEDIVGCKLLVMLTLSSRTIAFTQLLLPR